MNTIYCPTCETDKNPDDFAYRNKAKNIRQRECRVCFADTRKKSYHKNKQYYIDKNNRIRKRNVEWYRNYKSTLSCIKCGEDHPACLDFHHRDSNEKESEISLMVNDSVSIDTIKSEIEKCDVLCSNCHRKHHYNEKYGLLV
jgi:hypothetical protein